MTFSTEQRTATAWAYPRQDFEEGDSVKLSRADDEVRENRLRHPMIHGINEGEENGVTRTGF